MDELENVVAEKEPTSQNLSLREQLMEKNAAEFKREGNPDKYVAEPQSKVTDVKPADPIVKDAESDVKGKGFQRRVNELTKSRTEAEARAKRAEDRYAELEKRLNALDSQNPKKNEIDPSHYLDQAEYIKALASDQAKQAAENVFRERSKSEQERFKAEEKQREEADIFYSRVETTYGKDAEKISEFQSLVNENVDVLNALPADIHDFVDDSPLGVRVLETILKYPQFQELLMGIKNPAYRLSRLVEIERALSSSSASPVVSASKVSKAPDPIGAVSAGGNSVVNPEDLSFRERLLKEQKRRLNR